jgi:hypothetical protein
LIGVRVLLYPVFVILPGGVIYLLEPVVLLCLYAGLGWWLTSAASLERQAALREGALFGLLSGVVWIANLAVETFADRSTPASVFVFLPLLLGVFLLWGVAGLRTTTLTGSLPLAIVAAVWSAMNSIVMLVTFGFLLMYTSLPRLKQDIAATPEFQSLSWHDVGAYAIANTFDAGFSHLLIAPLIAVCFGTLGALISKGWLWLRAPRGQQW